MNAQMEVQTHTVCQMLSADVFLFVCFSVEQVKKYPRICSIPTLLSLIKKPLPPQDGMRTLCGCLLNHALDLLNGIVFDVG